MTLIRLTAARMSMYRPHWMSSPSAASTFDQSHLHHHHPHHQLQSGHQPSWSSSRTPPPPSSSYTASTPPKDMTSHDGGSSSAAVPAHGGSSLSPTSASRDQCYKTLFCLNEPLSKLCRLQRWANRSPSSSFSNNMLHIYTAVVDFSGIRTQIVGEGRRLSTCLNAITAQDWQHLDVGY